MPPLWPVPFSTPPGFGRLLQADSDSDSDVPTGPDLPDGGLLYAGVAFALLSSLSQVPRLGRAASAPVLGSAASSR